MLSPLLHTWNLSLGYAKRLVADLPDEQMSFQPAAQMNHATWVLGHLACTADMLGAMIGVPPQSLTLRACMTSPYNPQCTPGCVTIRDESPL